MYYIGGFGSNRAYGLRIWLRLSRRARAAWESVAASASSSARLVEGSCWPVEPRREGDFAVIATRARCSGRRQRRPPGNALRGGRHGRAEGCAAAVRSPASCKYGRAPGLFRLPTGSCEGWTFGHLVEIASNTATTYWAAPSTACQRNEGRSVRTAVPKGAIDFERGAFVREPSSTLRLVIRLRSTGAGSSSARRSPIEASPAVRMKALVRELGSFSRVQRRAGGGCLRKAQKPSRRQAPHRRRSRRG